MQEVESFLEAHRLFIVYGGVLAVMLIVTVLHPLWKLYRGESEEEEEEPKAPEKSLLKAVAGLMSSGVPDRVPVAHTPIPVMAPLVRPVRVLEPPMATACPSSPRSIGPDHIDFPSTTTKKRRVLASSGILGTRLRKKE